MVILMGAVTGRGSFTYPKGERTLIGVRYFSQGPLNSRRRQTWHTVPGGCSRGRSEAVEGRSAAYKIWEQEVYRDEEGVDWMHLNNSKGTKYNGWSPVEPCSTCHDKYIDDILADIEWKDQSACWDLADVGDWFGGHRHEPEVQAAMEICNSCPVVLECRDWAERLHRIDPIEGTYGGETARERTRRLAA